MFVTSATALSTLQAHPRAGKEVEELWQEYEAASSPEAMLVKDFDKVRAACDADIGIVHRAGCPLG